MPPLDPELPEDEPEELDAVLPLPLLPLELPDEPLPDDDAAPDPLEEALALEPEASLTTQTPSARSQ